MFLVGSVPDSGAAQRLRRFAACESSADFFVDMNRVLGKEVLGQKQVGLSTSSEAEG